MNKLKSFKNELFGEIRTVLIDGEVWFVLADVCRALGLSNSRVVAGRLDEDERRKFNLPRQGDTYITNESGLYKVILRSDKPNAKPFIKWVTREILPTIRKHGMYVTEELLNNSDFLMQVLTELKKERDEKKLLQNKIEENKAKLEYLDKVLESKGTFLTSEIAADYDISAIELNRKLHKARLIRHVGSQWILYKKHMGKEYSDSETVPYWDKAAGEERIKVQSKWTQRGREKIHEILTGLGMGTVIDKEA